jgi:hypothetical protein
MGRRLDTHTRGRMSKCVHDGRFVKAERVKEYVLYFGRNEMVNMNWFKLWVTLNPALELA